MDGTMDVNSQASMLNVESIPVDRDRVRTPYPGVRPSETTVSDFHVEANETVDLEIPLDQLEPSSDPSWVRGDVAPSPSYTNPQIAHTRGEEQSTLFIETDGRFSLHNGAGHNTPAGHLMRASRSARETETDRKTHDSVFNPGGGTTLEEGGQEVPESAKPGTQVRTTAGRLPASESLERQGVFGERRITPLTPPAEGSGNHQTSGSHQTRVPARIVTMASERAACSRPQRCRERITSLEPAAWDLPQSRVRCKEDQVVGTRNVETRTKNGRQRTRFVDDDVEPPDTNNGEFSDVDANQNHELANRTILRTCLRPNSRSNSARRTSASWHVNQPSRRDGSPSRDGYAVDSALNRVAPSRFDGQRLNGCFGDHEAASSARGLNEMPRHRSSDLASDGESITAKRTATTFNQRLPLRICPVAVRSDDNDPQNGYDSWAYEEDLPLDQNDRGDDWEMTCSGDCSRPDSGQSVAGTRYPVRHVAKDKEKCREHPSVIQTEQPGVDLSVGRESRPPGANLVSHNPDFGSGRDFSRGLSRQNLHTASTPAYEGLIGTDPRLNREKAKYVRVDRCVTALPRDGTKRAVFASCRERELLAMSDLESAQRDVVTETPDEDSDDQLPPLAQQEAAAVRRREQREQLPMDDVERRPCADAATERSVQRQRDATVSDRQSELPMVSFEHASDYASTEAITGQHRGNYSSRDPPHEHFREMGEDRLLYSRRKLTHRERRRHDGAAMMQRDCQRPSLDRQRSDERGLTRIPRHCSERRKNTRVESSASSSRDRGGSPPIHRSMRWFHLADTDRKSVHENPARNDRHDRGRHVRAGRDHSSPNRGRHDNRPSRRDDCHGSDSSSSESDGNDRRSSRDRKNRHSSSKRWLNSDDDGCRPDHSRRPAKPIQPKSYNGKTCVETWILQFLGAAEYNGWTVRDCNYQLRACLVDPAAKLLEGHQNEDYRDLIERLRRQFGESSSHDQQCLELFSRIRRKGETVQELAADIDRRINRAFDNLDQSSRSVLAKDYFVRALGDPKMSAKVYERQPETLQQALDTVLLFQSIEENSKRLSDEIRPRQVRGALVSNLAEAAVCEGDRAGSKSRKTPRAVKNSRADKPRTSGVQQNMQRRAAGDDVDQINSVQNTAHMTSGASPPVMSSVAGNAYATSQENAELRRQVQELRAQMEAMCRPMPQPVTPPSTTEAWPPGFQSVATQSPHPPGNFAPSLPPQGRQAGAFMAPQTYGPRPYRPQRWSYRSFRCYNCNRAGHMIRDCPYPPAHAADRPDKEDDQANAREVVHGGHSQVPVYLKMKIGKQHHYCLLDSGCDLNILPRKVVGDHVIHPTSQRCIAANGSAIEVLGWCSIPARVGSVSVEIDGLVSSAVEEVMLGSKFLLQNNARWDFGSGQVTLKGQTFKLHSRGPGIRHCRRVIVTEDTVIPPRSQAHVMAAALLSPASRFHEIPTATTCWSTEPVEVREGLIAARVLVPNRVDQLPMRLLNTTNRPIHLPSNTVISSLELVEPLATHAAAVEAVEPAMSKDPIISEMLARVDSSVDLHYRDQLRQLMEKYSVIFSRHDLDLGWTDLVTHRIDIGNNHPFRQPLRRYSPDQQQAIDQHVRDMLQQGVIEPCDGPFASNLVLVKKKDGTYRCCVDYRQLNDLTVKDAYPLPRIDVCLDTLAGSCLFSSMDMKAGYHQLSMSPEDRDKTAFVTRRGLFRFRTLPFGLCNATASFSRLIQLLLSGLNFEVCLAYLDDLLVFSRTPQEHLDRLELVFQRLAQANLKLKPSKCNFFQTSIDFLGHTISAEGVAPQKSKTQLIHDWPVPRTLRELRGFLGLTGYYRKFIADYAHIVEPLNALMHKNQRFVWSESCQQAFETLKSKLVSPSILAMPNETDPFVLDTDAADHSIGAVLSQRQNGVERVIAYAGRTLTPSERHYCTTRKELLALVYFTRYFKQYLLGRPFVVRTDHSAINWLRRTPDPIGQNARWIAALEDYQMTIQHRPGRVHSNVDAISRHPCLNKPSCTACHPAGGVAETELIGAEIAADDDITVAKPFVAAAVDVFHGADSTAENETEPEVAASVTPPPPSDADLSTKWSATELIEAQEADAEIKFILDLLKAHQDRPQWRTVELQSNAVKSLWYEWNRLVFRNGVLCRKWTDEGGRPDVWQIVLPQCYRMEFVATVHAGMTGGHLGRAKTEDQIRRRAYWPGWKEHVASELRRCAECAGYHRGKPPRQTPLQPFAAGHPFETIALDITGPHPRSSQGHEYILTITCLFSKFCEAYPIRTHTATVIADVLVGQFCSRYGLPRSVLSDNAPEFTSELFRELCVRLNVEKLHTSFYNPRCNAACERFHRTLNSMLAKVVAENHRNWHLQLLQVMAAYRASRHESTGFSPNYLVFGQENRMPIDLALGDIVEDRPSFDSPDEYVSDLQDRMRKAHDLVRQHLGQAAERRKDQYDAKVKPMTFEVGTWVWYYSPRRYAGKYPKWMRNYSGPYLVTKALPPCDYVIQKGRRSTPFVAHQDKLKTFHGSTPLSWLQNLEAGDQEPTAAATPPVAAPPVVRRQPKRPTENNDDYVENPEESLTVERRLRPAAKRRPPRWRADYAC